jgi:hypothetical protein
MKAWSRARQEASPGHELNKLKMEIALDSSGFEKEECRGLTI